MANADAFARLQAEIDNINALPAELVKRSVPAIAKALEAEIGGNVAAARGPDGKPWARTKSGDAPLKNAAQHVSVRAVGTVIIAEVSGVEAKHHKGQVKGGERRPIIPVRSIPEPLTKAIRKVLGENFREIMAGGK